MKIVKIPEPGDVVVVWAKRDFDLCTSNDLGGTQELPAGRYRVRITKTWDDYETGQRCIGKLLDAKDIAISRKAGTTGTTHEGLKKKYPKYAMPKNSKAFHPERVYFHASEIESTATERR